MCIFFIMSYVNFVHRFTRHFGIPMETVICSGTGSQPSATSGVRLPAFREMRFMTCSIKSIRLFL